MSAKSEFEAAYYTLLRAREEQTGLFRFQEFLEAELARLDAFAAALRDAAEDVPRALRRPVTSTDKSLLEALGRRRVVLQRELGRMPDRHMAAAAFVEECEAEVEALRP